MTPLEQEQRNEIGRLNRIIDDLRKAKAALHQDVIGQREAIQTALHLFDANRPREAYIILQDALDYRHRQQTPRKTRETP